MISEERYKQAMEEIGKPNSTTALAALKRLVNEAEFLERLDCNKMHRIAMNDLADRYRLSTLAIRKQNERLLEILSDIELMKPRTYIVPSDSVPLLANKEYKIDEFIHNLKTKDLANYENLYLCDWRPSSQQKEQDNG